MKEWKDDKALFALIKEELYTAVVGDIMDKMGYTRQFLPPRIRPLRDDMLVAGRAMTVLEADVLDAGKEKGMNPVLKRSFGLMLEALDDLKEDEVYVCSGCLCLVGRADECPCDPGQGGRSGCQRLLPRYEGDFSIGFPLLLLRSLRPGPGAAWKGDRLPCADRNGGRTDQ